MKLLSVWIYSVLAGILVIGGRPCHADGLQWQIPGGIGTVQLPTDPTAILPVVGYDFVQKEAIAGGATSLVTLFKEIDGYVGAVGNFNTGGPFVQPYLAIGSDFARYVPALRQVQNLEIQGFVRYVPNGNSSKNYGSGVAIAYKFGAPNPVPPQAPSQPPAPPATLPPVPTGPVL